MTQFEILTLWISAVHALIALLVGGTQCLLIWVGLKQMSRASEARDKQHEETMAALEARHRENMGAQEARHRESMRALEALLKERRSEWRKSSALRLIPDNSLIHQES